MTSIRARAISKLLRLSHSSPMETHPRVEDASKNRRRFEQKLRLVAPTLQGRYTTKAKIPGAEAYWISPPGVSQSQTIIFLHGGGFVNGSTKAYLQHIGRLARVCGVRVLSIDYRLAPEHPYPAALDDILVAWKYLLKTVDPASVTIIGESAGGSLALAATLRMRDENLPTPSGVVLLSPALDMSLSGESIKTRAQREVILNNRKINYYADVYAGVSSRNVPYISPVVADLTGLPPLLIHVGTEEMLYSDSITIAEHAKRDGVACKLYVGKEMWHGWHVTAGFVPEAKRALEDVARFVRRTNREKA